MFLIRYELSHAILQLFSPLTVLVSRASLFGVLLLTIAVFTGTTFLVATVINGKDISLGHSERELVQHSHPTQLCLPFMVSMHFVDQLTTASKHYTGFLSLAADWGMTTTDPLVCESKLYGLSKNIRRDANNIYCYKFKDLYDVSFLNKELTSCLKENQTLTPLIREHVSFLSRACREITYILFLHSSETPEILVGSDEQRAQLENLSLFSEGKVFVDCTAAAQSVGIVSNLSSLLNWEAESIAGSLHHQVGMFSVKKVICVDGRGSLSLSDLKHSVLFPPGTKQTVIFSRWQAHFTARPVRDLNSIPCYNPSLFHSTPHSQDVVAMAKFLLSSRNFTKPFLSLHLRTERIMQYNVFQPGFTKCCLKRLKNLLKVIIKHQPVLQNVLAIRDYHSNGYGTETCYYGRKWLNNSTCKAISDKMVDQIQRWGISFSEYSPADLGTRANAGYVSVLEAESLLHGDVLVTVGFGSFQSWMIEQRVQTKRSRAWRYWYSICTKDPREEHLNGVNVGPPCSDHVLMNDHPIEYS